MVSNEYKREFNLRVPETDIIPQVDDLLDQALFTDKGRFIRTGRLTMTRFFKTMRILGYTKKFARLAYYARKQNLSLPVPNRKEAPATPLISRQLEIYVDGQYPNKKKSHGDIRVSVKINLEFDSSTSPEELAKEIEEKVTDIISNDPFFENPTENGFVWTTNKSEILRQLRGS